MHGGAAGGFGAARIDHDHPHAALLQLLELPGRVLRQVLLGNHRIATDHQQRVPLIGMHPPALPDAVQCLGQQQPGLVDRAGRKHHVRADRREEREHHARGGRLGGNTVAEKGGDGLRPVRVDNPG